MHEATAGVSFPRSENPITEGSRMKSWSEDHLASRAPRGPSSSKPRERARGWGRGSGKNCGRARMGKPGVPWPPPPTGAPLNGRRRGAGKGSQADSHPTLLVEPPHPSCPPNVIHSSGSCTQTPGAHWAPHLASNRAHPGPTASTAQPPAKRVSPLCKESRSRRKVTSHMP